MKNLFVYIQVKPIHEITFGCQHQNDLKEGIADLHIFEIDNHSDHYSIEIGKQLIDESNKIIIYMESSGNEGLGSLAALFEYFRKSKKPILAINDRQNDQLTNIGRMIKAEAHRSFDLEKIRSFLSTS